MTLVVFQEILLLTRMGQKNHQGGFIMAQTQRKRALTAPPVAIGPEFFAVVRHLDGRCERFIVRRASDLADARELVEIEVGDVRSLLIAQRH
ncbi:MAG: hypothetical protein L6Q40_03865 [Azonexus sp.]|nr:hypothetical protein [Azonexus sp.]